MFTQVHQDRQNKPFPTSLPLKEKVSSGLKRQVGYRRFHRTPISTGGLLVLYKTWHQINLPKYMDFFVLIIIQFMIVNIKAEFHSPFGPGYLQFT